MRIVMWSAVMLAGCAARVPVHGASECAPAGPCVVPLEDAFTRLSAEGRVTSREELELQVAGFDDVDGDGTGETWVSVLPERGATGNEVGLLYLGAACPRFAGEVFGESARPLESAHCGVRDLEAYSDGGCAGMAGTLSVLVHDGERYREDPARGANCECPDDAPSAPRDPRCPGGD